MFDASTATEGASTVTEDTVRFRSGDFADDQFFLCSMHGREALSQLFEYQLMLSTQTALDDSDITKLLQKPAAIVLDYAEAYKVHGVVRAVEVIPQVHEHEMRYLVTLVPRLWYLTQTRRARVYIDKTVPEIVKAVLTEAGLEDGTDFAVQTAASHPKREFTVQYDESDFQFVSRLLEYEGMHYHFDHSGEVEKLVVADGNAAFTELSGRETIAFSPVTGTTHEQVVRDVRQTVQTVPRLMFMRDYNPKLPTTVVASDRHIAIDEPGWPTDRVGHGVQVGFGENVATPAEANRVAQLRAEELLARKTVFSARANVHGLHPGHMFTLENHAVAPAFERKYLVTEMTHTVDQEWLLDEPGAGTGESGQGYQNDFEAIPGEVVWRPLRLAPRPRIDGVLHAVIDGDKPHTAAPIDETGCYRVILPYDTVAELGGRATLPIRFAQGYAGPAYGMHFPLHQGTEVLLAHVDGDPDRPVIVGAVPNPRTVSPVVSPDRTTSMIVTRSKIQIRFDDDA